MCSLCTSGLRGGQDLLLGNFLVNFGRGRWGGLRTGANAPWSHPARPRVTAVTWCAAKWDRYSGATNADQPLTEAAVRRIVVALLAALGTVLGCGAAPAGAVAGSASPGSLQPALGGVSCVSASSCVAVGARTDSAESPVVDVPLAMIWNGARWRETA